MDWPLALTLSRIPERGQSAVDNPPILSTVEVRYRSPNDRLMMALYSCDLVCQICSTGSRSAREHGRQRNTRIWTVGKDWKTGDCILQQANTRTASSRGRTEFETVREQRPDIKSTAEPKSLDLAAVSRARF
jgi:hypothetical protein